MAVYWTATALIVLSGRLVHLRNYSACNFFEAKSLSPINEDHITKLCSKVKPEVVTFLSFFVEYSTTSVKYNSPRLDRRNRGLELGTS